MTLYQRSRQERNFQFLSFLVALVTSVLFLVFSGPFFWPWGLILGLTFLGLSGFFFVQTWLADEKVEFREGERGPKVILTRFGSVKTLWVNDLVEIKVYPSSGKTRLVSSKQTIVLFHQLLRYESLLARLRQTRPELFPVADEKLLLQVSLTGKVILAVFGCGIVLAGILLSFNNFLFLFPPLLFALVPFGCALWFSPVSYEISSGRLLVRHLLRRKVLRGEDVLELKEDAYAAAGCTYFLIRLVFPSQNVILDEGQLLQSLRPQAAWIRRTLVDSGSAAQWTKWS